MIEDLKWFILGELGIVEELVVYFVDKGVVVIGVDIWGVEVFLGFDLECIFFVYSFLLVKWGIYILENM